MKTLEELKTKPLYWTKKFAIDDKLIMLISEVERLGLRYQIRNFKYHNTDIENKFYLFCVNELIGEFFNPEYAKIEAQEHMKNYILKIFFE